MADDGMLMNFDLGVSSIKPQVKFRGGSWRERKRAQKTARFDKEAEPEVPPSKKRRTDEGHAAAAVSDPFEEEIRELSQPARRPDGSKGGVNSKRSSKSATETGKEPRQVISRLFSFNPERQTKSEPKTEWTAPEPTNAPLSTVANFGTLTLSSRLVEELSKMNLERPTAIQNRVIPHLLSSDADAFVQAETGSGKTFAYLLPILHRILLLSEHGAGKQVHRDSGVFAIIVSPTRELAKQTHAVLEQLLRPFPWLVSTAITGGESKKAEKARIRKGVNFLVATPGRLADHIDNTKSLSLGTARWLVLDEGDRLMDLGFEDDLEKAIAALRKVDVTKSTESGLSLDALPTRRVTVLCSATMKMNVQKLGEMSLADATFLAAEKDDRQISDETAHRAPAQLHQTHIVTPAKLRLVALLALLKSTFSRRGKAMKVIVFMSCADSVDFHFELLKQPTKIDKADQSTSSSKDAELIAKTVSKTAYITSPASSEIIVHRLHGSLSQPIRSATLRSFASTESPSLLIATDVASRGLDIPSVEVVIEYDPGFSFDDHIHRIGRTARAGKAGDAILFLLPGSEEGYIELLKAAGKPTSRSYESVLEKGFLNKMEVPVETQAKINEGDSYHNKAEALQLHIEQRILNEPRTLELARDGFKSHIRAYATHTKEERVHFDISELHLGHLAKSYGLREPPGGIGAGIDRKTRKNVRHGGSGDKTSEPRPARDVINAKSRMLMNAGADEFNIG